MRKIVSSIISLVLVSLALLANIYAWYTVNKDADASGVFVSCEKSNVMVGDYSILKYNKDTQEVDTTDAINLDDYDSIFESNNTNLAIVVCIPFETSESSLNVTFSCDGSVDDKCISNIIDFKLILPTSDELDTLTDNLSIYNYATSYESDSFSFFDSSFNKESEISSSLDLTNSANMIYLVIDYSESLINHFGYGVMGDEALTTFTGDLTEIRLGA